MKVLIVHPEMSFLGGGERLCCETMRTLLSQGHEITLLSETFDPATTEAFFGYRGLFDKVTLCLYPSRGKPPSLGTTAHLIHHLRGQKHSLRQFGSHERAFDLLFSTQDPGYIPDMNLPAIQWGYIPKYFSHKFRRSFPKALRSLPLRLHYKQKISRIGLVLAISQYSKSLLDTEWKRPSVLVYPACNMVHSGKKRNMVVTVARANPAKRLELFWKVARLRPKYEFVMLLTRDPSFPEYSLRLSKESPGNGTSVFNPGKESYHRFLSEAKVYLHLMENEHFGITIVEAMSAGCVPVVHDSGGPREIVNEAIGFRWRNVEDIPNMVDEAVRKFPLSGVRKRAEDFTVERFEKTLSSVFLELQA